MNIHENIKALRKSFKMTQGDLAKKLGVQTSTVSAWELGRSKPLMSKIYLIAEIFGVSVGEVMGESSVVDDSTLRAYEQVKTSLEDFNETLGNHLNTTDLRSILEKKEGLRFDYYHLTDEDRLKIGNFIVNEILPKPKPIKIDIKKA